MAARQLPARRYFAVLALIIVGMYALIFLTGSSRTPQLGLDLQGGTTVTLTAPPPARPPDGKAPKPAALELARQIIEQRVNGLGVAEAEVVTEGDTNIVISVPGDNAAKARQPAQPAMLRLRAAFPAGEPAAPATSSATPSDSAAATGSAATDS